MKKWMVVAALALTGCAQLGGYEEAVKTPAPANLQGNWQTVQPQDDLISDQAVASLIISPEGDTLDCRQWQRVIAKPGKLTLLSDDYVNVNVQDRVMPVEVEGGELHYDGLTLRKMNHPTAECQKALDEVAKTTKPRVIQNIEPDLMRAKVSQTNETK